MVCAKERALVARDCGTWPLEQQTRWLLHMAPEIGAPTWRPVTQYQCAGVYTRYLATASRLGYESLCSQGLKEWIKELEGRNLSARTIAGYVKALHKVSQVVLGSSPDWLHQTYRILNIAASRSQKKKNRSVVPAEAILQLGFETITRAKLLPPGAWSTAQRFRDGLFLVFGIYGPERLRALADVRLSDIDLCRYLVRYPSSVMKGGTASCRTLPEISAQLLNEWVTDWRPRHMNGQTHDCLWIGKGGGPLGVGAITAAMKKLTATGPWRHPISPHRLRDAAATCLVDNGPQTAHLASIILGHRSEKTTQAYIETSTQIAASRAGQVLIAKARDKAEHKNRSRERERKLSRTAR